VAEGPQLECLQVLHAQALLIEPSTSAAEAALQAILPLAQGDVPSASVLLTVASAFVKAGQIPKARSQLKRINVRSLLMQLAVMSCS
jgi:hypothetical protein